MILAVRGDILLDMSRAAALREHDDGPITRQARAIDHGPITDNQIV
jgi:hypothetical protein